MNKPLNKCLQLSAYFWNRNETMHNNAIRLADALDESGYKQYEYMLQHLSRLSSNEAFNDNARIQFAKKIESLMTSSSWLMELVEEDQEDRKEINIYEKQCINF